MKDFNSAILHMMGLLIAILTLAGTASCQREKHSLLQQLQRSGGWTMLIGDSVLQQEFLAIAKMFLPDCNEMAVDLSIERAAPAAFFQVLAPPEYALICKKSAMQAEPRCRMLHQPCLALTVPQPCPDPRTLPFCGHNNHPVCDVRTWKRVVRDVTAEDVEFAVTFHWAPGPGLSRRDPDIGALQGDPSKPDTGLLAERLAYRHPKAIIMNNCLHSWPYSWRLPSDRWRERLHLFLQALQVNLQELSASAFQGEFGFQACMPLACTEHLAFKNFWGLDQCPAQNSELMAVNAGVRRLFSAMNIRASFFDTWDIGLAAPDNYNDGIHPCFTRPCSWTNADGKPVLGGTAISNPRVQKYDGLMDMPSSVCLDTAERIMGRLNFSRWPVPSDKRLHVPIPDLSDLWAQKFINDVPPVSPSLLRPTLANAKPPVRPHLVYASTGAPAVGTQAPMIGATARVIAKGAAGPSMPGGASAPVMSPFRAGQASPSLSAGTLPPAYATESPKAEYLVPMWMWVLIVFLALVCISQAYGSVTDASEGKSTTKPGSQAQAVGLLSLVEFESDEVELAK